ncbi:unnamed protein product, partial [Didymodactylos carnosus]
VINVQPALGVKCFCKCCTTKGCKVSSTPSGSYDVATVCQAPSTCNSLGCSIKLPALCTAPGADGNTEEFGYDKPFRYQVAYLKCSTNGRFHVSEELVKTFGLEGDLESTLNFLH